eukprot:121026-Alexandrium_andersonii.AAC.1
MNAAGQEKRRKLLDDRRDAMLAKHCESSDKEGRQLHRLFGFHLAPPLRETRGGGTPGRRLPCR